MYKKEHPVTYTITKSIGILFTRGTVITNM